jgi:hypothetical protein
MMSKIHIVPPNPTGTHVPAHEEIKNRHKNKLSSKKHITSEYFNPFDVDVTLVKTKKSKDKKSKRI